MLLARWPGSFGAGYWPKYCDAAPARADPQRIDGGDVGGVMPYQPDGTVCVLAKPRTGPPGQAAATAH